MKALFYFFTILFTVFGFLQADEPYLIVNMSNKAKLPKNFRIDPDLNASASGQFSVKSLDALIKAIPKGKEIVVIDLRQESHGFINGAAVSWRKPPRNWSNVGKALPEIIRDETDRLRALQAHKFTLLYNFWIPFPIFVHSTHTEEEVVKSRSLKYLRIPVTDHRRPADAEIDRFVLAVRGLPANSFLAIHCAAGKGRSTTLICMYDMIRNAKKDSYESILERQFKLGGVDYLAVKANVAWKQSDYVQKQELLKKFYGFCRTSDPLVVLWTEWLLKNSAS